MPLFRNCKRIWKTCFYISGSRLRNKWLPGSNHVFILYAKGLSIIHSLFQNLLIWCRGFSYWSCAFISSHLLSLYLSGWVQVALTCNPHLREVTVEENLLRSFWIPECSRISKREREMFLEICWHLSALLGCFMHCSGCLKGLFEGIVCTLFKHTQTHIYYV